MIDKTKFTEHELELINIALEQFPVAFELAINTGDEDLFFKLMTKANKVLVERTLGSLIDKGYVEMTGIDETGDFTFSLTEKGKEYATTYFGERNIENGPEL